MDGELFLQVQEQAYDSYGIIKFLDLLQEQIDGKLIIIWDGAPIHRSKVIKQYLKDGAAKRIHLEQLPGYSPDLNPGEGIWNYLKRVELKNKCCKDLHHLHSELLSAEQRLRAKPGIVTSCFDQVDAVFRKLCMDQ